MAVQGYLNDFNTGVHAGSSFGGLIVKWEYHLVETPPNTHRYQQFMGRFGNEPGIPGFQSLVIDGLPAGNNRIDLFFQLFIIDSWDGNDTPFSGPDTWKVVNGSTGVELFAATFSNGGGNQSYPGHASTGGSNAARTGAVENNTLGYTFGGDSIYQIGISLVHVGPMLHLFFRGEGLQERSDESWGLDEFRIEVTPVL